MKTTAPKDSSRHLDFALIDVFALVVSFALSYLIKFRDLGFVHSDSWMALFYIAALVNLVICLVSAPYSGIFRRPYYEEIVRALLLTFYNLLAAGMIFYVFKIGTVFSRQMILTMYGLYFLFSLSLKCIWKKLVLSDRIRLYNAKKIPLFVIGSSANIGEIIENASSGDFENYEIAGVCLADGDGTAPEGVPAISGFDNAAQFIKSVNAEEVLVALSPSLVPDELYKSLISAGTGIHLSVENLLGFQIEDYGIDTVGVYNTLSVGLYSFTAGQVLYSAVKRFIDVILGAIGAAVLLPVTALIKLIYLISGDTAPIIYKQERVGKNGRTINIYKFRTMVPDADRILRDLLADEKYKAEWEANQKLADDPRITKTGRLLRKTSVDELPQLINVLRGEMSLVGPRPLVPGELEAHGGLKLYQQVKPGITGWWGCNGRSNINYRERLELEYYYVKNFSIYLDFLCVLRTFLTVLRREGAE
ncbi:MAG: sugar transferase [Clostridia bacterium]|nr:sugar transferase [Clostridia bacterium]